MKWITRKNVKVDRVACPWLIRRFVDPEAEFLFVDEEKLLETAHAEQAIPFDAPRIAEVKLNHRGTIALSIHSQRTDASGSGSILSTSLRQ